MIYRQGDIFLARLSPGKGSEPGKDRPVIIVQSDSLNEIGYPTCIVVPCSSIKMPKTSIRPLLENTCFDKKTYALLDQVRAVDVSSRFLRKIGSLTDEGLSSLLDGLRLIIS